MPLYRRLPKRGFNNDPFKEIVVIVNLQQIDGAYEAGMVVDRDSLIEKGIVNIKKGLRNQER